MTSLLSVVECIFQNQEFKMASSYEYGATRCTAYTHTLWLDELRTIGANAGSFVGLDSLPAAVKNNFAGVVAARSALQQGEQLLSSHLREIQQAVWVSDAPQNNFCVQQNHILTTRGATTGCHSEKNITRGYLSTVACESTHMNFDDGYSSEDFSDDSDEGLIRGGY
jgi:hypothetical protein